MMKLEDFKKFVNSEFFGSNYIHGGKGVDTQMGTSYDWAHTTTHGADEVRETVGKPNNETNDPL